jgi:hypothetical protein
MESKCIDTWEVNMSIAEAFFFGNTTVMHDRSLYAIYLRYRYNSRQT